eukprot:GHVS01102083.1.p1 GENE.GHVS01102083.1~~GHVS01102083.1.p1  ORF type:complete len:122 (-),score=4.14 GHVS01102083.1:85-450(-)
MDSLCYNQVVQIFARWIDSTPSRRAPRALVSAKSSSLWFLGASSQLEWRGVLFELAEGMVTAGDDRNSPRWKAQESRILGMDPSKRPFCVSTPTLRCGVMTPPAWLAYGRRDVDRVRHHSS